MKVKLGLTCRSGVDRHWSWGEGGRSTLNFESEVGINLWIDTDPGGGRLTLNFESEVGINLRIWGGSTLIRGGSIDTHFESEVGINLRIWGGSILILGGVDWHSTLKVKLGLTCRSGVDRHWSWGGGWSTLNFESEGFPLPMHCGYIIMHYG